MKLILLLLLISTSAFAGEYKANVTSVWDGDTFTAKIKLGFGFFFEANVRMYGINTPEMKTGAPAKASKKRLTDLIHGKEIKLVTNDKKEREKYGRVLATIFCDGININELMAKEGLAKVYME